MSLSYERLKGFIQNQMGSRRLNAHELVQNHGMLKAGLWKDHLQIS